MVRILALAFALFVAGCSKKTDDNGPPPATPPTSGIAATSPVSPAVDPGGFDRACTAATDCVVVKRAGCDPCACANDAIASKAMAHFDDALGKLACAPPDLDVKCDACKPYVASCENKLCVAKPRP